MSTRQQRKYSIIIPIYNCAKTLALTLDSVCNQNLLSDQYEIIIVDNGSSDNAEEIISNLKTQNSRLRQGFGGQAKPEIKYFKIENGGSAKAINFGIKQAEGEIVFFTGGDYIVPKNWMKVIIDGYRRHPDAVGVGGWRETLYRSFLEKCFDDKDIKFGGGILDAEIKTNLYFFPYIGFELVNLSYKKLILEECGGFDENLHSAEWIVKELNIRALSRGYLFLRLPFRVKRIRKSRLKDFFYQYFDSGKDLFYLYRKYSPLIRDAFLDLKSFFIGLIAYADISHFYIAYCLSNLFEIIGKIYAKYFEYSDTFNMEETNILPNKNFEIIKYALINDKRKIIRTCGQLFNNLTDKTKNKKNDFYSVIVPTYNRAKGLIKAIENLINQTISPDRYEIIVVNDGSTDDTEIQINRLCQGFFGGQAKPEIRYFKIKNGGPAKARNFGVKKSKGKFVFFTDDDCVVPKNWMETIIYGFEKYSDSVGVGGGIWPPEGEINASATSRFLHFESFSGHPIVGSYIRSHEILSDDPLMFFGNFAYNTANICYKKEIFEAVGGFKEDFYWPGSEDNELAFRIAIAGYPILYLPFHVTHPKNMTFKEFAQLHFRRGANGYLLRAMHRELLEKLKPGFADNYGSMVGYIHRLNGPEKFLAFIQWLSVNAGIRYMKRVLKRRVVAGETRIGNHF